MATQKPEVYKPFVVLCIAHIISRVLVHLVTKSQRLFPYFQVELFNDVIVDLTGSRVIPEIDMAAAQIGSNSISAHRTRNKIPTAIPMFSMSSSTMLFIAALCAEIRVTSGFGGRHIYFRYNTTSGDIFDSTVEQLDLENLGTAVGIFFLGVLKLEITLGVIYPRPQAFICM